MNDAYIDQSAGDLNLCLYAGIPSLEGQVLFKEHNAEISHRQYVSLGIVGASHFFSYRSRETGFEFTELLACTKPPPFLGVMHVVPFRIISDDGFGSAITVSFPVIRYNFAGTIENATADGLTRVARFKKRLLHPEGGDGIEKIALAHDFSAHEGRDAAGLNGLFHAETLLLLEISQRGRLKLITVHTYPNEGKIVSTSSTLF